jgi:hypothetical protein
LKQEAHNRSELLFKKSVEQRRQVINVLYPSPGPISELPVLGINNPILLQNIYRSKVYETSGSESAISLESELLGRLWRYLIM